MTRLEQLRKARSDRAAKLADDDKKIRQEESKEREKARKAHNRRCYKVGALVAEAGLFALEDGTLGQLMALLTPLAELPDPVGTLDALIGVPLVLASKGVPVVPTEVRG